MEDRIDEQLINNYTRPLRKLKKLKAIVVHWTANTSPGADAQANRNYFNNLRPQYLADGRVRRIYASAHYMVDDKTIIRCVPDDEMAYHVGARYYKPIGEKLRNHTKGDSPNYYTIGIEMCVNSDGDWNKTYAKTVELTRYLLDKYNLTINELYRHYDITGKLCPKMMIEEKDWQAFKNDVVDGKPADLPKEKIVEKGVVLVDGLNVRAGNSVKFPVVKVVNKGDEVEIYDKVAKWYRIGDNVWSHSNFIKIVETKLGEVEAKVLNIRKGPGTEHDVVGSLKRGDDVKVIDTSGKWLKVGEDEWIHGDYVLVYEDKVGKVNFRFLNVRSGPSIDEKLVGKLKLGDEVHILKQVEEWYYIGDDQWVHSDYIDLVGATA